MANGKEMTRTLVGLVLALVIGAILIGNVLPVGVDAMFTADTSAWDSTTKSIWDILPIFVILAALVALAGIAMDTM